MADQPEGRGLRVVGDIQHRVPHLICLRQSLGPIDRLLGAQAGLRQVLRHAQAVKFQPDIFPWLELVGAVSVDLTGQDQEPLPRFQIVAPRDPLRSVGLQKAPAGNHIVKQVMVAHIGSEGVERRALLPAALKQPQVQQLLVGRNREGQILHIAASPFLDPTGVHPHPAAVL